MAQWQGSSTYHEAGPSLGGGHLVRSGDLVGDQSLEFLQLLEQGPEEGTAVTRQALTQQASLPPGALRWGTWAGSRFGFHTRCPFRSRQKMSPPAWFLCGVAQAPGACPTVNSWVHPIGELRGACDAPG